MLFFFYFKQKTAYELRISDWSSDVCSSYLFSALMGKRVLVIDLDPQTNATLMLIGEDRWSALNAKGHTLARLFQDAMDPDHRKFDMTATLQKGVSDVRSATTIDLLPSSLDLIDVQIGRAHV